MKNIFDYIEYYKNIPMKEYNFNETDSLIFALLSYVKLKDIVPNSKKDYIYLDDAINLFIEKFKGFNPKKENWLFPNCYKLMETLKDSKRYKNLKIYNHIEIIDKETQFSAITIRLDKLTYISYRGTDSSIVGWREDLEMFYKDYIPSQKLALKYLEDTINFFDRNIYIGGHSKGGNLSMYAYMFSNNNYKKRVKKVYNYDGPGLKKEMIENNKELYQDLTNKLITIVPNYSIVGMTLENTNYFIVNSPNKGLWAHDGFSWEVFGGLLFQGHLSKKSTKLKENLKIYLDKMTNEEKEELVINTFDIFKKLKIEYTEQLQDLKINEVIKLIKDIKNIPNKTKSKWIIIIKLLLIG